MEPLIRAATDADVGELAWLSLTVWDEAYADMIDPAVLRARHDEPADSRAARWAARIAREKVLVAVEVGAVVGFARVADRPNLELLSLYTRRSHWRSGLGTRLLNESLRGAAAELWVFEGNARALHFYEHHGFSLDGQRREDPPYGFEVHMTRP
ncbi:GNAT family N-acetyltransferase [Agreia pratensis]|uniref:Ribosomal protein S18 acetylase RimI n=1 Tax=Agreia pratensis TaxID=150121 RepID=A0A1X7KSC4_9MICO|nr:GNAT family N-acetyltransferase [Agreia pratensis]SMG44437.1 Ribosomal protein S18 acetylase RimI [Agreia pratensis]